MTTDATAAKPPRIWYQSFTDPAETASYHHHLHAFLLSVARPGTTIDVVGMSRPSRKHRITELRCALEVARNAVRAEAEGYDAFVLGHFQDSGLWEARSSVEMPVVGLGESAMLHACTLGAKIGLVTIDPIFIPIHEEQIRRYGLQHRVVDVVSVQGSTTNDYVKGTDDPGTRDAIRAHYVEQVEQLSGRGIEVVIPAGGLPGILFAGEDLGTGGTVVLDCLSIAVKAVETAIDLRRFNGTRTSRRSTFALPSEAALKTLAA